MPLGRRQELLDWAAEQRGRYIIEDDHDSEFRYVGKPIPSLQSRDQRECVIYMGTFSKSISPAFRISYMVLPGHLLARFRKDFGFYSSTVSSQQQRALARFMSCGDFERHLNRMRRIYKGKHDFLLRELKKRPWVSAIKGEQAGLHLLVRVDSHRSEEELIARAHERGVQLYGMSSYQIGGMASGEPVLLFGFGGLDEMQMTLGLEILDGIALENR
jgi:GntR family transcriptional regulator/MocR family aminotransferase